jgi:hypothetical protein
MNGATKLHHFVDFIVRQKVTRSKVADGRHGTATRPEAQSQAQSRVSLAGLGLTLNSRHDRAEEDMNEDTREERGPNDGSQV